MGKLIAIVGVLFGCFATTDDLKKRASFDMQCAQSSLTLTTIDATHQGVSGCGKQAVYRQDGDTWSVDTAPQTSTGMQSTPAGQEGGPCEFVAAMKAYHCAAGLACVDEHCVKQ